MGTKETGPPQNLTRTLGTFQLWCFAVGLVISGEYFGWSYGWATAGTLGFVVTSVCVAAMYTAFIFSFTELTCSIPRAGGPSAYARRAFGPTGGYLAGVATLIEFLFAPPAIALAIGAYLNVQWPALDPQGLEDRAGTPTPLGMPLAITAGMHLLFDRGTLLLHEIPHGIDPAAIPGVCWDARVAMWRAPGRLAYPLAANLRRRGVAMTNTPCPKLAPPSAFRTVTLRPYQQAALHAWRLAGRRGLVALPTGSGKTRVALAAMATTAAPSLCLVPTRALLGQWMKAITEVYDGPVGCLGDGERQVHPITVATFASAYRHMPLIGDRFGLLVVDEAHHFGNTRHDDALDMAIAPLRLGLSATPPFPGPAATKLALLVGPTVFELHVGDLTGNVLAPLDRITLRLWLQQDEQKELDNLTAVYRHAFHVFTLTHPKGRWEDFVNLAGHTDEGRRGVAAWRRTRRLLAYPLCKQRALACLLAQTRERRTLVFVADNETAYRVARENLIMPLTCDIGRAERDDVLARFASGQLRALVSAAVLNEGLDVPDADVGIVVAGRLGEREHTQRVGRLLRPGVGKRAVVYEMVVQRSSEVRQAEKRWSRFAATSRPAA